MTWRRASGALLLIALVAGVRADRPRVRPPLVLGGYRVLAADFHIHSSMWSDGGVTPWGLVLEAERQGLDAIAVTGHNEIWDGRVAQWFSHLVGGPTILIGQEAISPDHHIVAVGTHAVVDSEVPASQVAAAIHAQGGVAIAAHPFKSFWPGYDAAAIGVLDGAEICHPGVFRSEEDQRQLEQFAARGRLAAIGSSDFHGIGAMGLCRTYVFARDNSADAIVEALRAHRTVVYGRGGKAYGDPELIALAATHPELRAAATTDPPPDAWEWVSRVCGVVGLLGVLLSEARRGVAGIAAPPSGGRSY